MRFFYYMRALYKFRSFAMASVMADFDCVLQQIREDRT